MRYFASRNIRWLRWQGAWVLGWLLALGLFLGACAGREMVRRSADEWFDLGREQLARGKYQKAETAFSKLLEQHPQDRRRAEALLGMAEALYSNKRYEEAKFQYRRFLELYPTHAEVANAQFHIAMSAFQRMRSLDRDQTLAQEALQEFQRLVKTYPRSTFVEQAKQKLAACRERLAASELYVGRFYYKKGAYTAAIGRFDGLLRAYPEVSFADEALFLLGDTYVRNENPQQAATVFDELVKRYPQSPYASNAKARLASLR
ncbi:MAG: outer membrane protein assembly factor BamD [Nitrospinae bacterium]|nr:outer membrane protein assembly factor BamD [Nitrospinota bacterium]